jgi:hypothetical protein
MQPKILDIGGGFPVDYALEGNLNIYDFCEPI